MHAEPLRAADARREAAARAARLGRPILLSVTRPLDPVEATAARAHAARTAEVRWQRPVAAEGFLAHGVAHVIESAAAQPAEAIAAGWRDLLAAAVVDDAAAASWSGPLALGGFAFDPLRPPTTLWTGFPSARFVVPARLLIQRGEQTWLTTNELIGPPPPTHLPMPGGLASTAQRGTKPLSGSSREATMPSAGRAGEPAPAPLSGAAWQALVAKTARGIADGTLGLDKVVLARAERLHADRPFDPAVALERLVQAYPTCTVFAIRSGAATFLGATPERLVDVHDGVASTMALAATIRRGATPDEDAHLARALLASAKERTEHAIVASALRQAFDDVCTRVVADAEPRIERLPNLQHLLTSIRGQLAPGRTVLDVVARLHPTPAVGGAPRGPALDLLRRCESLDRGWYAGALGWLNRAGDGEFSVGIRSALVHGTEATLFAGCGIVADSDAAAEYAESTWKLRPMLAALGAPPA